MNALEKVTWGYVRERTLQMKWNKQNFLFIAYYIFCASLSFIWNKTTRLNSHHTKEIAFEGLMGNAIYNSDINVIKYRLLGAWILFTFSQGHKSIDCTFAYEIIDNFTTSLYFQLVYVLYLAKLDGRCTFYLNYNTFGIPWEQKDIYWILNFNFYHLRVICNISSIFCSVLRYFRFWRGKSGRINFGIIILILYILLSDNKIYNLFYLASEKALQKQ